MKVTHKAIYDLVVNCVEPILLPHSGKETVGFLRKTLFGKWEITHVRLNENPSGYVQSTQLVLHGSKVATIYVRDSKNYEIVFSFCGWGTNVTKDSINFMLQVIDKKLSIRQKNYQLELITNHKNFPTTLLINPNNKYRWKISEGNLTPIFEQVI